VAASFYQKNCLQRTVNICWPDKAANKVIGKTARPDKKKKCKWHKQMFRTDDSIANQISRYNCFSMLHREHCKPTLLVLGSCQN